MTDHSVEAAIDHLRAQGVHASWMEDTYLDVDPLGAAQRFSESAEFEATCALIPRGLVSGRVVDLGAGRGIGAYGFAQKGAEVVAVEPDMSCDIGAGAAKLVLRSCGSPVVAAGCPHLPFPDSSVSVVYARQVLHHLGSLHEALRDVARILVPGGLLIAVREHVVDDDKQLQEFLDTHPVHQLAGGENAFPLAEYVSSIGRVGLQLQTVLGPWDSVINAFPLVRDQAQLECYPSTYLGRRLGALGRWLGGRAVVRGLVWRRLNRPVPGRMYSFIAYKPMKPSVGPD